MDNKKTTKFNDSQIINAWHENASAWIKAIEQDSIQSRLGVTNQAILNAILSRSPQTVLDAGCGEGWLIRELSKQGIACCGIDPVPEFIDYAKSTGAGAFFNAGYEELGSVFSGQAFDVVVCNFSLLGDVSVNALFANVARLLNRDGVLIIQTIHPCAGDNDEPSSDGWREGSWCDVKGDFADPAPWYFRTLSNWLALFDKYHLQLVDTFEPCWSNTNNPASIILVGQII